MSKLRISDSLSLPREAVTSTFVIYGGKGMGKTNFGSVFAEELSRARLRYSVIDPMGVWWGLRHSADGKSPGIELLILGGVKGDMPIEPSGGAVVADMVVDESVNILIDISRHANGKMWSIGERIRFVRDYFVQLYARQGEKRQPLMQVVDEAARFAPQTVRSGDVDVAQCLGAVAVMVEEGRNVGVGVTLLTQRSARLNKDVAELADVMIAFRIVGPRSISAVMDWFGEHIPKERWKDLIAVLRKLPIGRALVVSPGWLEFEGEAQIRPRETFDSSATPKPGQKAKTPRGAAAKPDLAKYRERMAETIERAEANDPAKLKKKIQELERDLAKKPAAAPAAAKTEKKTVYALKDSQITRLEKFLEKFARIRSREIEFANRFPGDLSVEFGKVADVIAKITAPAPVAAAPPAKLTHTIRPRAEVNAQRSTPAPGPLAATGGDGSGPTGKLRNIMVALAQNPDGLTARQIGGRAGVSTKGGSFTTWMSRARTAGWITGDAKSIFKITPEGLAAVGPFDPLPTGAALFEHWLNKLGKDGSEAGIFRALYEAHPNSLTKADIETRANVSTAGGSFTTWMSRLRTRDLITDVARGEFRAADELFES